MSYNKKHWKYNYYKKCQMQYFAVFVDCLDMLDKAVDFVYKISFCNYFICRERSKKAALIIGFWSSGILDMLGTFDIQFTNSGG